MAPTKIPLALQTVDERPAVVRAANGLWVCAYKRGSQAQFDMHVHHRRWDDAIQYAQDIARRPVDQR